MPPEGTEGRGARAGGTSAAPAAPCDRRQRGRPLPTRCPGCVSAPRPLALHLRGFFPAPSPPRGSRCPLLGQLRHRSKGSAALAPLSVGPARRTGTPPPRPSVSLCPPRGPRRDLPPIVFPISRPEADERGEGLGEGCPGCRCVLGPHNGDIVRRRRSWEAGSPPHPGRPWDAAPTPAGPSWGARSSWDLGRGLQRAPTPTGTEGWRVAGPRDQPAAAAPAEAPGPPRWGSLGTPTLPWGAVPALGVLGMGQSSGQRRGRERHQNSFTC